ncbi:MAG TPA: hypothetical protein VJ183_20500 [Chloroflexia bacterium]|nr:hypothetical protein [Chloroflexia bacterium]
MLRKAFTQPCPTRHQREAAPGDTPAQRSWLRSHDDTEDNERRDERRIVRGTLAALALAGSLIALLFWLQLRLPRQLPSVAVTSPLCGKWDITLTPGHYSTVDVASDGELWFAGTAEGYFASGPPFLAFARWDGVSLDSLKILPAPTIAADEISIRGLDVRSSTDAWAVGYIQQGRFRKILTLHWNGLLWSVVPTPKLPSSTQGYNQGSYIGYDDMSLDAVTMIAPDDVWAVGYYDIDRVSRPLTLHWDGTTWHIIPGPNVASGSLRDVISFSKDDVWAFGQTDGGGSSQPSLVARWDGQAWGVVDSPQLGGMSAASVDKEQNIWVINSAYNYDSWMASGMLARTTKQWTKVEMPRVEQPILYSVAAYSPDDVWAVGDRWTNGARSLVMHWDGLSWGEITGLDPSVLQQLHDVAVGSSGVAWIVGTSRDHEDSTGSGMIARFVKCSDTPRK